MRHKLTAVAVVVIMLSLFATLLAGCGQKPATQEQPKPEAPKEIKIGLIAPMTGDVATFGQSTRNAVMLAAEQWNAKGGINGAMIKVVAEDDRNDPVESANAALKLINQDKVVAIIGSVASKCSLAIAPIAQQNKIPMISPTSTNEKVTLEGDYIFRACFIDPFQGFVTAKFAAEELKVKTAAMLYDMNNDYTVGLAENFRKHFTNFGGRIVADETYAFGDQDFRAQLTRIKATNPEVLFLPDYYQTVSLIMRQARELGITSIFVGGDGWDSDEFVPLAGEAAEGGFFSNHYSPDNKTPEAVAFIDAYKAKYGAVPDALAALGYDAALVLFNAIEKAGSTEGKAIRDAMAGIKIKAVSGEISFDPNGNPVKSAVILTIENGKQKFVKLVNP